MRIVSILLVGVLLFSGSLSAAAEQPKTPTPSVESPPLDDFSDEDFDAAFEDDADTPVTAVHATIADPLEYLNRGTFWVNDKIYFYALKPAIKGYRWAVPRPGRISVKNVFSNLIVFYIIDYR